MTTKAKSLRKEIQAKLGPPVWREENHPTDDSQVKRLWDAVLQATGNPLLLHFLSRLIDVANVPARDPLKLARAIQLYSARKIKFFRERPERFQHPLRTISWGIGDCDDKSIFIATSLRTFRVPIRMKFLRIHLSPTRVLGHVYPLAYINGEWIPLESVREYPWGYDPEAKAKSRGFKVTTQVIGDPPDTLHA